MKLVVGSSGSGRKLDSERKPIRLLLADDHFLMRQGVMTCLESQGRIKVVGHAADGIEAVNQCRRMLPDVVLMDITMPRLNGLDATRRVRRQHPETRVLILTIHDSPEWMAQILDAGASGCILKDSSAEELCRAVETVSSGGQYFSQTLEASLRAAAAGARSFGQQESLSEREREVLRLIAEGYPSKHIAVELGITTDTISTYRKRLMRKLGINHIAGLTRFAVDQGIIPRRCQASTR